MNDHEFQDALKAMLEEIACMDSNDLEQFDLSNDLGEIENVRTFEEAGLLTSNAGLVIGMADGSEFQVTIVRSN